MTAAINGLHKQVGPRQRLRGFSLIELLVVMAILVVLISMLLPSLNLRGRAMQSTCMGNLKQAASILAMYSADRGGGLPIGNGSNPYTFKFDQGALIDGYLTSSGSEPDIFYCPSMLEQVPEIQVTDWMNRDDPRIHGISNSEFIIGYAYVVNSHNLQSHKQIQASERDRADFYSARTEIMVDTCAAWRPPNASTDPHDVVSWRTFPHNSITDPKGCNVLRGDGSVETRAFADLRMGYRYHHPAILYW